MTNTLGKNSRHALPGKHPSPLAALLPALAMLCFGFGMAPGAQAATFVVTKTADTNDGVCAADCSLREAIRAANASVGVADTINVPAETYTFAPGGSLEDAAATGDLDITDTVTIIGSNGNATGDPALTVIQAGTTIANGIDKVFSVNQLGSTAASATFKALTIKNGRNTNGPAGTPTTCTGTNTPPACCDNATTFAHLGAGIDFFGGVAPTTTSLTIDNCVIRDNTVANTCPGGAAGVSADDGNVTITNSFITNNQTTNQSGGGVSFTGTSRTMMMTNTNVSNNKANAASGEGGGVYIRQNAGGDTGTVSLSRITGNTAPTGSGLFVAAGLGTVKAENNWWGCDGLPGAPGCDTVSGTADVDPRLDLVVTATSPIPGGGMSTVTADVSKNSTPASVAPVVLNGLPITFSATPNGTMSPTPVNLASFMATSIYTNTSCPGPATVSAKLDNGTATAPITINCNSDLAVTKGDAPDPVVAGDNITYTINFSNGGPASASSVTVTDAVPANTTFVSAAVTTGTGWTTSNPVVGATGNVVFSKASVASGETAVFQIVVKVDAGAGGTTISNTATVATTSPDPNPANNTGTATTTANTPTTTTTTTTLPPPTTTTTTLPPTTTTTTLPPTTTTTTLSPTTTTTTLPPPTTTTTTLPPTTTTTTLSPTTTTTTLPPPTTTTTTLPPTTTTTTLPPPTTTTTLPPTTTTTTLPPTTTTTTLPPPTTTTTTLPPPTTTTLPPPAKRDLAITKTDSPDPVEIGDRLTYTVRVRNNGPGTATGVKMIDTLPAGVSFVSATPSQGSCTGMSTVTCNLGTLAAGRTATVILRVKPKAAGTITNKAKVTGNQADPTPANNSATQSTRVRRDDRD